MEGNQNTSTSTSSNKPSPNGDSNMTTKTTDERILAAKEIINNFNKEDGQKIDEGIKYLENIKPTLPLPRTISGHVKIVDDNNIQNNLTTCNSGLLVSISGISNPAEDKEENEDDYSCYTDPEGKFTITMPDKYNMQETITISVSKKNDMTYAIAGQSTSHKVEFVKLASEVLRNEYLYSIEGEKKNAADILYIINDISEKNAQAKEIEKKLNQLAYCEYAKEDLIQKKGTLEKAMEAYKDIINEEAEYHIEKSKKDIENVIAKKDEELSKICQKIYDVEKVYEPSINILYNSFSEFIKDELMKNFFNNELKKALDRSERHNIYLKISELTKAIVHGLEFLKYPRLSQKNIKDNLVSTVNILFNELNFTEEKSSQERVRKSYRNVVQETINFLTKLHDNYDYLIKTIDNPEINSYEKIKYYNNTYLTSFFTSCRKFYEALKKSPYLKELTDKCPDDFFNEELDDESVIQSMKALECDLSPYNEIRELYINVDILKATWAEVTQKSENKNIKFQHLCHNNYSDPYEDIIHMLPSDCGLLKEKIEDYKNAKNALQKINEGIDYIEELKIEFEKTNINNSYYTRFKNKLKEISELNNGIHSSGITPYFDNKSQNVNKSAIDNYALELYEKLNGLMTECQEQLSNLPRFNNVKEIENYRSDADAPLDSEAVKNSTEIERYLLNFLSTPMDSEFEDAFVINQSDFEDSSLHPRALPSVKLMGDGKNEVYLPTDTAPSRMFNYTMVHRLVEPQLKRNGLKSSRYKLNKAVEIQKFKECLRDKQEDLALASTLGIGYALNMHQAWVPDGFALGNLLYSLVLAPGEEQRLIVREHKENYTVSDDASAIDKLHDSYSNSQVDNETAAFNNAVSRYSTAHSDSAYTAQANSSGKAKIKVFLGIGASSSASSTNSGSSYANSNQRDSYDEASRAAQNFQTSIKTESERIASANRTSIRVASSEESEAVSSRIVANHNHSHVMTIQYWEVARRYRLETCIDGIELLLFVPLELIRFMPDKDYTKKEFSQYTLQIKPNGDEGNIANYNKENFEYRYKNILKYYDTIEPYVPAKYRSGLNLIKKFAALPYWGVQKISSTAQKYYITITGGFCEFDNLTATIYFNNGSRPVQGILTEFSTSTLKKADGRNPHTRKETIEAITNVRRNKEGTASFAFTLPYTCSKEDISQIKIYNNINSWKYTLSKAASDMDASEQEAVNKYEQIFNFNKNNKLQQILLAFYSRSLPECYSNPEVSFSSWELHSFGDLEIEIKNADGEIGSGTLGYNALNIYIDNTYPTLRLTDIQKIEETFHHIVSDTMYYSQVVWSSLSDDERIILLEPYTIEIDNLNRIASSENSINNIYNKTRSISLLNCVNAKNVVGFYGNCMMLPFTFPKELAELIGKTAGDIQDELYRYHACNFRVPSTVISIPTDGMVGEAVLGATNVSEKIDITRFWNWKDSDIDHIDLNQSSLNGRSLLENASTRDIEAPTVGVTPTEHVNGNNLAADLIARQQPTFADVYQNTDMRDVMKNADNNASAGREQVIKTNAELTKAALDAAVKAGEAALTGGASGALGGAGGALSGSSLTSLVDTLGKLGLSNEDILKSITSGGGKPEEILKAAAALSSGKNNTPNGENNTQKGASAPDLTSALKSFGGEKLQQFLSNFASTATNGQSLEESFQKSLSSVIGTNKNVTLNDILEMSNKFCSENNIDLNSFTSALGKALGLL